MPKSHTIAILLHEKQRPPGKVYLIEQYAEVWKKHGHQVLFLYGTRAFVPADIIVVHVDLSVVPDEYLEFASRYPLALNGRIRDVRKSTYSTLLLREGDSYSGPVIVKTDLNYAGQPERRAGVAPRESPAGSRFRSPLDYRVYAGLSEVPPRFFTDADVIIERFVPEREGELYVARSMLFLGDRVTWQRRVSLSPIVKGVTTGELMPSEPHPEIQRLRDTMNFDFGKFDYVVHDGQPLLIDMNKTVGMPHRTTDPELRIARRYRAEGLYGYFDRLPKD